jgi:acetyl esterase/lipase
MKHLSLFLTALTLASAADAQTITRDIPYAGVEDEKRTLDVYAPDGAKDLPVVFWIHGGGWQAGDKSDVKLKPQAFMDKGFVFVSVNYRLLPAVDMGTLTRDVAKSFRWVQDHISEYGGDPKRVLVGGHSAGTQLAAQICTDERYLKEQGVSFDVLKGCVPVDGRGRPRSCEG